MSKITKSNSYIIARIFFSCCFGFYLGFHNFDFKIFVAYLCFFFVDIFLQIYEQKKVPFHKVIVGNNNSIDAENTEAEKWVKLL